MDDESPLNIKNIIILVLGVIILIESIFFFLSWRQVKKLEPVAKLNQQQIDDRIATEKTRLEKEFADKLEPAIQEEIQKPWNDYFASDVFGAFSFKYPRFYQIYVKDFPSSTSLNIIIDPEVFIERENQPLYTFFKLNLSSGNYGNKIKDLENVNKGRKANKLTIQDITVSGINGKVVWGKIEENQPESKNIFIPYRDKILTLTTYFYKDTLPNGKTREAYFDEMIATFSLTK